MADASEYVTLLAGPRGGLTVPAEPLRLMFEMEDRGFTLTREGDVLVVTPSNPLTAEDAVRLRRWKFHILSLLDYEPPECA